MSVEFKKQKSKDKEVKNIANLAHLALEKREESRKRSLNTWIEKHIRMKEMLPEPICELAELPTKCYGDVEFRGATRRSRAKFIRISDETRPDITYNGLMMDGWQMERPRLLISIVGSKESFNLDSTLKANFCAGLSKIAQTAGAWVITGGFNSGVVKHVGDALQGSCKQCIGILPWGVINNKEVLIPMGKQRGATSSYDVGCWLTDSTDDKVFLDSNHTHFLFVDDGGEDFGCELRFRRNLEQFIMEGHVGKIDGETSNERHTVPSVIVVVNGGFDTLASVRDEVCGDNPVPTVLVKESGGLADLLVFAMCHSDDIQLQRKSSLKMQHKDTVDLICAAFKLNKVSDAEKIDEAYNHICELLEHRDMFFEDHPQVAIDDAILTALLSDTSLHHSTGPFRQLQLTLVWERADLAREEVLATATRWEGDPKELNWVMIMALARDNVEFVKLLLDYGVSISSFLTNEVLEFLHGYRSYDKSSPLRYEIADKDYKMYHTSGLNGTIYKAICMYKQLQTTYVALPRKIIEGVMKDLCSGLVKIEEELFIEDLSLSRQDLAEQLAHYQLENPDIEGKLSVGFKYPFRELFFWAVLHNMQKMALFLWSFEEEHMAKALIAAEICGEMLNRRENQEELEKSLSESSRIFQARSVQLLDQCYKEDEMKTQKLLTSSFNQFPGMNNLNLAVNSGNLEFVSHSSVQVLLTDVWTGNMKLREVSMTDIALAIFFPCLINKFEFRTEEEILVSPKTDDSEESLDDSNDEDDDEDERGMGNGLLPGTLKKKTGTQLGFHKKLYQFYWCTPVVKFLTHVLFYFLFLGLFAYVAMLKKETFSFTNKALIPEFVVIITVFSYLVNEIYQVAQADATSLKGRIIDWMGSGVNILDGIIITLFFIALGFRLSEHHFQFGHLLLAIDCGMWILRLFNVLYVSPVLGPYFVMIVKMIKDLMTFMIVLFIVLLAYGVTSAAILYPVEGHGDITMLSYPIWQPYFNIYGLMMIDYTPKDGDHTRFGSKYHTAYDEPIVWLLMGVYLLMTNILLLNLLIAVFNNTYNDVQSNSSQYWKFQRHSLIMEYSQHHPLPPPFSLLAHMYLLVRWFFNWLCGRTIKQEYEGLKFSCSQREKDELIEFECNCVTRVTRKNQSGESVSNEELTTDLLEEIESLKAAVTSMDLRMKLNTKREEKERKTRKVEERRKPVIADTESEDYEEDSMINM